MRSRSRTSAMTGTTVTWGNRSVSSCQHVEDRVLAVAEQQDLRRLEAGELAAELAADRAAGARDQHGLAGGERADLFELGLDRLPAQEVLDLDLPERGDRHLPGDDVLKMAGTVRALIPASSAACTTSRTTCPERSGHRDDDLLDLVALHQLADLGPASRAPGSRTSGGRACRGHHRRSPWDRARAAGGRAAP